MLSTLYHFLDMTRQIHRSGGNGAERKERSPHPLKDESGNELSFFAANDVQAVLDEHKLKSGVEFILTRVENGKKGSSKLQVSIIGKETPSASKPDNLKDVMIQPMRNAAEVVAGVPLGFRAEDARAVWLSLFIART